MATKVTTVTRLTSQAPSAIAILELAGPSALDIIQQCWKPNSPLPELKENRIRFGYTRHPSYDQGESVVVCRTSEDRVELHCHGGQMASEQLLSLFVDHGAVEMPASKLVSSADPIVGEALLDLTKATTMRTTSILMDQWRGALSREMDQIDQLIVDGHLSEAKDRLQLLKSRWAFGKHLIEPWNVVLAGPPNAGKSSLLNRLLGYTRAIVHEQAGTTRDLLAEKTSIDGWPIQLIDGAGIRDSHDATDAIEVTGIARTLDVISDADCTLLLIDPVSAWTETHSRIAKNCAGKLILVYTKSDLVAPPVEPPGIPHDGLVSTSCVEGDGVEQLMELLVKTLVPSPFSEGQAVPFRERHLDWINSRLANF